MVRVWIVLIVLAFLLSVYTVADALISNKNEVRNLPKGYWVVINLILPVIGPVMWLVWGRPKAQLNANYGPDADEEFINSLAKDIDYNKKIKDLEEQLASLDDEFEEAKRRNSGKNDKDNSSGSSISDQKLSEDKDDEIDKK